MEQPTALQPGESEIVRGPYGTYKRYYLSDEELNKYRELPRDSFWEHNSKPHVPPVSKTKVKVEPK